MRQNIQGVVTLRVEVLPDGTGGQVLLHESSGSELLDDAAITTVRTWRFQPATENGKPVRQWVNVPITFRLSTR